MSAEYRAWFGWWAIVMFWCLVYGMNVFDLLAVSMGLLTLGMLFGNRPDQ